MICLSKKGGWSKLLSQGAWEWAAPRGDCTLPVHGHRQALMHALEAQDPPGLR